MRWFGRGPKAEVGAAWSYLLRVTTRGFFGELALGVAKVGIGVGRRVRLAARLFSPSVFFRKRKPPLRRRRSRPSPAPFSPGPATHSSASRSGDTHRPNAAPPR
jgi:hypothetical protein